VIARLRLAKAVVEAASKVVAEAASKVVGVGKVEVAEVGSAKEVGEGNPGVASARMMNSAAVDRGKADKVGSKEVVRAKKAADSANGTCPLVWGPHQITAAPLAFAVPVLALDTAELSRSRTGTVSIADYAVRVPLTK